MKILALEVEQPGASAADFVPHLQVEARAVWDLTQAGTIREVYFRSDRSLAVMILEAADTQQAEAILGDLPLVKAGLIRFEVIGLQPYPGFGRLFKG